MPRFVLFFALACTACSVPAQRLPVEAPAATPASATRTAEPVAEPAPTFSPEEEADPCACVEDALASGRAPSDAIPAIGALHARFAAALATDDTVPVDALSSGERAVLRRALARVTCPAGDMARTIELLWPMAREGDGRVALALRMRFEDDGGTILLFVVLRVGPGSIDVDEPVFFDRPAIDPTLPPASVDIESRDVDADGRPDRLAYVEYGWHDAPRATIVVFSSKHRRVAPMLVSEAGGSGDDEEEWRHLGGCWAEGPEGMVLWLATSYRSAFEEDASVCVVGARIADDGAFDTVPFRARVRHLRLGPDAGLIDAIEVASRRVGARGAIVPAVDPEESPPLHFPTCAANPTLVAYEPPYDLDASGTALLVTSPRVVPNGPRFVVSRSRSGTRGCLQPRPEEPTEP